MEFDEDVRLRSLDSMCGPLEHLQLGPLYIDFDEVHGINPVVAAEAIDRFHGDPKCVAMVSDFVQDRYAAHRWIFMQY